MGDDKDPSATIASETASSAAPQAPVSVVPRPVSVVPRPLGAAVPTSRMPPPPSSRGIMPGAPMPGALRTTPPPAPQRNPPPRPASSPVASSVTAPAPPASSPVVTSVTGFAPPAAPEVAASPATASVAATPATSSVAASPSVVPRAPATPPPPPQRHSAPPVFSRPLTQPPGASASAQLEQRLGATQLELRKLGSERHTLRARLRRDADRLRELESALRAEKELRGQASEEHFSALIGLRTRLAEVEAERDKRASVLAGQLEEARADLQRARAELEQTRAELEQASARKPPPAASASALPGPARAGKVVQGLRRIRGIGPAYQRVLEQLGVSRVQQVAGWTDQDILTFAEKLKIRPDRITKDDWVGQARSLEPDD